MKKNIIKKLFIKISKILGFELIDQNEFVSPTLNREINKNLTNMDKSIVLPLGEVNISRKIKSLLILFRTNTDIEIWDQNKKRIFEKSKIEYALRSLNSLIKSAKFLSKNRSDIKVDLKIIDNGSTDENLEKIKKLVFNQNFKADIIIHNNDDYKNIIKQQKNHDTFSNLSSLLKCFELSKEAKDIVYFIEDDYLHFETSLDEMIGSFERISSQIKKDIFVCSSDYPYLYMNNEKTNILIGNKRHWRTINKSLCSFMTSKSLIDKYWDNFYKNCLDRHEPFEKYLNEIFINEICISPIKSLSIHMTNINSSYGLSPFINYKSLWDENKYD
tara:strand:- start:272 stop:1261 length:990 start_codon:yes stop_codon:yes gene_type:complete